MIRTYLPQIFIALGVLFSFIGGLMMFIRTNESNRALKEKTEETIKSSEHNIILSTDNKNLITQNLSLTEINNSLSQKNIELIHQNIDLTNSLKRQSEIINSNVTGGNSFCLIQLSFVSSDEFRIILINEGEFPLYNIQVRIVDLDEFRTIENATLKSLTKNVFHISELSGRIATIIGVINLNNREESAGFNIFYDAKNGSFTQLLRLRKSLNGWYQASRVERNNEIIYEKIDEGYPIAGNEDIWKY